MLRKTKLYSLLLVIVLSTVIGLFGLTGVAYAEKFGWAEREDKADLFLYDDESGELINACPGTDSAVGSESLTYLDLGSIPDTIDLPDGTFYAYMCSDGVTDKVVFFTSDDGEARLPTENDTAIYREYETGSGGTQIGSDKTLTFVGPGVTPSGRDPQMNGGGAPEKTCQIAGVGWIICPTLTFLAVATDSIYSILDKVFLRLPPVNMDLDDDTNGMYRAWKMMRDVANIVFVIAFLVIVFSQVTNVGLSSYGLKQLVPKIIISAILVNTSYFICALAVDVSNIIGSSLKDLLDGAAGGIITEQSETAWNNGGGFRAVVATTIIAVGAGAALLTWATLPLLAAAILFVLPIALAVLITMIVRQALVVLLIVIAPLAFVSLLLPNTEGYFKKWQDIFKAMLLLYPVVALVFGASALASTILMAAANDAGDLKVLHQIAGAAVQVLPLVFIPALMKISSGVFGRITGMVNDRQKGWFDNMRNTRMENHQFNLAKRAQERGRDPNRIRAFDRFTPHGSAVRAGKRKARLKETESTLESAFLESEEGQAAHNSAENAQKALQTAQINAETVRIGSVEGMTLQQDQVVAEMRKQTAENAAQTQALDAIPTAIAADARQTEIEKQSAETDAKTRGLSALAATPDGQAVLRDSKEAEFSSKAAEDRAQSIGLSGTSTVAAAAAAKTAELEKTTAENRLASSAAQQVSRGTRRAAYESGLEKESIENRKEAAAIRTADNNLKVQSEASAELLNAAKGEVKQIYEEAVAGSPPAGVSGGSVAQAQAARRDSNVTGGATDSAKRVSQQDFSQRVLSDSSLAAEIGGIDPHGKTRAKARAASTITGAFEEAVSNEKKTMSTTAPEELDRIMRDVTQSAERRAAAASTLVKTGSTDAVLETINYLGEAKRRNEANIGDIQQQVIADIGNRKPTAVGATAVAALGRGEFDGTMDELIRGRIVAGKVNASTIANMPVEEIDHMIDVVNRSASLRARPEFAALQAQIREYLTNTQLKGQQPASEIISRMKTIAP